MRKKAGSSVLVEERSDKEGYLRCRAPSKIFSLAVLVVAFDFVVVFFAVRGIVEMVK